MIVMICVVVVFIELMVLVFTSLEREYDREHDMMYENEIIERNERIRQWRQENKKRKQQQKK